MQSPLFDFVLDSMTSSLLYLPSAPKYKKIQSEYLLLTMFLSRTSEIGIKTLDLDNVDKFDNYSGVGKNWSSTPDV